VKIYLDAKFNVNVLSYWLNAKLFSRNLYNLLVVYVFNFKISYIMAQSDKAIWRFTKGNMLKVKWATLYNTNA
jgi:hypothetical protein